MPTLEHEERETRRIILLRGEKPEVWLCREGAHRTLPDIPVPGRERIAEHLISGVEEILGIAAISLFLLEVPSSQSKIQYEVMESCSSDGNSAHANNWASVEAFEELAFRDSRDAEAVRLAVNQTKESGANDAFGKPGWFDELVDWVRQTIEPHGLHLNGRFRQLNASRTFSLIRFETDGPAVWFKATGSPNRREFPLTQFLMRLHPRSLPRIIATHPEWNGWLALEVQGTTLNASHELGPWIVAARALAELQIGSLNRELHLLEAGARDLRPNVLAKRVEPFFQMMGDSMERQIKIPPLVLSRAEISGLASQVVNALAQLQGTDFPATLGHLDLHPQNVIVSPVGAVFLDWAEGFVGHPFLTFQYLLEHFRCAFGEAHPQEPQLIDSYSSSWRAFASDDDILRARKVAPLLAAFTYAAANELWNNPRKVEQSHTAAALRSLTRRMSREARMLPEWSVPCPR